METIEKPDENKIAYWEVMTAKSRYASYTSGIEKAAILKAHGLATGTATALDIGCEGGRWSKLLSDLGWRLICTDINLGRLNICQNRIPTATCILSSPDDSRLPCDTEGIGLILCIEVGPVITADWFIDEAFRILQKRGLIVGVFWNRSSYRGLIGQSIATLKGSYNWYSLSYPVWRKRFSNSGFTILHEEGICWPPFRRTSNSSLVPVATRMERILELHKLINLSPWVVFIAQKD